MAAASAGACAATATTTAIRRYAACWTGCSAALGRNSRRAIGAVEVRLVLLVDLFAFFFIEVVAAFDQNRALVGARLAFVELMAWAREAGIEEVTIYAFSTENWSRASEEVAYLMELFDRAFATLFGDIEKEGTRIRFIGDRSRLSESIREKLRVLEERSAEGDSGALVVAFSYGGRPEILAAVNALPLVVAAPAGLVTVMDLPVRYMAAEKQPVHA